MDDLDKSRKESNEKDLFFNLIPDLLCIASAEDGYFKDLNFAWEKTLGFTREELLSKPLFEFIHPDDLAATMSEVENQLKGQPSVYFENRYICKDGSYRWLAWTSILAKRNLVYATARDITEHKTAMNQLVRSEDKYRTLLNNIPQKIFYKDINSGYMLCNESYAKDLNIEPVDIIGKTDYDFHTKELAEKYRADDKKIMESGKVSELEETYVVDRNEMTVNTLKAPILDENGKTTGIFGIFWDITERKRVENALVDSEEKYRNITENAALGIIVYNEIGQCTATNKAMAKMLGATVEQLLSQNFYKIESWKKSGLLDSAKEAFASDEKKSKSFYISTTFGKDIWLNVTFVTYIEKGGKFLLFLGEDITERKKADVALQQSNSLLTSIIESPDNVIMFSLDKNYNYLSFNKVHVKTMKRVYDADIEVGQNMLTYIPREDDRLKAEVNYKRVLKSERFIEIQEYGEEGSRFWFELIFNPIFDDSHYVTGFTVFVTEITERKELEIELKSSNTNLLALIESTDDATLISDRDALPVLWNKTYARIMKEALGVDMRKGLQPHKNLKDEKAVVWWDNLHRRVLSGESFREEYAHDFGKDDIRHFEISYNPIFENGKITGFSEFTREITERKNTEKKLQEAHSLLETRVKERTLELSESNATLKVLLKQREQDKSDFENNVLSNIKQLVMPYIMNLKRNRLNSDELSYINIIESNLKEIVSPFSKKLLSRYMDFTPKEIQIANLIRDGKQDKDIMEILNISIDTVKTHRKNIRRKLDIYGKRINLRTTLLSMTE